MPKFACRSLAFAALAAAAAAGPAVVAQDKEPVPMRKEKKDAAKEKMATGTIEITQDKQDMYRFKIVLSTGKTLAQSSKGYATHEEVVEALEELKEILHTAKVVEPKKGVDKKRDKMDTK